MEYEFQGRSFSSFSDFIQAIELWHDEVNLSPFRSQLLTRLPNYRSQFAALSSYFLSKPAIGCAVTELAFSTTSETRDVVAASRRFLLGQQPRGVHLKLRECATKEEHVAAAINARHPNLLISEVLDPTWRHVFDQFEESFKLRGPDETWTRALAHRERMMTWVRQLAVELEPIRLQAVPSMPPVARAVSSHIHWPLFYTLLDCVGFPNPDVAFRFFLGAPIVGHFYSPALIAREALGVEVTDANIRSIAQESLLACYRVNAKSLSTEGGAKSMEKRRKEFATGSYVGPFDSHASMCNHMEAGFREIDGCENFSLDRTLVIAVPEFVVEEQDRVLNSAMAMDAPTSETPPSGATPLHQNGEVSEVKVRNIWNGVSPNQLCSSWSTYRPNTHADVAAIILRWVQLFLYFSIFFDMHAWPSDFSAAYRQQSLLSTHTVFSGSCFWDHELRERRWAYYRSLPFGSALAPAGWSETVQALCFIMAMAFLAVLTHCVDDVCCAEVAELVSSSRDCFIELCGLIGLRLDMDKTLEPCTELIYLGLYMILPSNRPWANREFSLSIPEKRLVKLIGHLKHVLNAGSLSPGDAASHRGRLYFYAFWDPAARSFLAEFAARQYDLSGDCTLTPELATAIEYFLYLLQDPKFLEGVKPAAILNRLKCVVYTDGALEGAGAVKGIGGVLFLPDSTPISFGEQLPLVLPNFDSIAPIEMQAIHRALELFGPSMRGRAVLFFVDNTHAIGCLLKRSTSVRERRGAAVQLGIEREINLERRYSHFGAFQRLPRDIKRFMNEQARAIWFLIHAYDLSVWFEYVKSACNVADPPSRGEGLPGASCRIRARDFFTGHFGDVSFQ